MIKVLTALFVFIFLLFSSCRTLHYDKVNDEAADDGGFKSLSEYEASEELRAKKFFIEEEVKKIDVEKTVIYIDRPVFSPPLPEPDGGDEEVPLSAAEAVAASLESAQRVPLEYQGGVMRYPYDESFIYDIHTRPYRVTDIILEPGEVVLEQPIMSENNVWEVAAGVSRNAGQDVQHFFLKPSKLNLSTDMIIITDRHVYHLNLKSFPDRHMIMVKWNYPPSFTPSLGRGTVSSLELPGKIENEGVLVDPSFLSFDYKLTYSVFKKPLWLPRRIYDDGSKTYIQLDSRVLHTESPALFNKNDERINYRLKGDIIILDELIEKVTLRLGKERAVIEKKRAY
jgi:type IV secretion system protein VirB9